MSQAEIIFSVLCGVSSGFCLGLMVGQALVRRMRREFDDWRADVLETMAASAEDARDWSKFTDHVIAMDKQRSKP